ncbi:MAG: S8 family serine peptidase [Saprospiraceae bacterium]|nr:S8 family serine peptidase [Saprospiraceae bacterium]
MIYSLNLQFNNQRPEPEMNVQTFVNSKILLLTFLSMLAAQGVLHSQGFQPLFKMDQNPNAAENIKQRSQDLKMNIDLIMFMDAYEGMKPGETVDKIMPLAKDFLVMSGDQIALEVVATDVTACMESLKSQGASRIRHFKQVINCLMPMATLNLLKNLPNSKRISLVKKPVTNIGAATSQGDIAQLSDIARIIYNVNGAGNKIGVLSDSYNDLGGAMADITTGDLPGATNPNGFTTPIDVLSDLGGGGIDEGRAMLQIIHDVAPGAELAFHTAFIGDADFAQGILDLHTAGCNIIVDDVFYFAEPYYMPGIIAQAVDQVCSLGAMYFSSAGNQSRNSYEGIYTGGPSIDNPMAPFTYISSHEFAPGDPYLSVALTPGEHIIILQWDQPFFSATGGASSLVDLDLYAYDTEFNIIGAGLEDNVLGSGDPVEGIGLIGSGTLNLSVDFYGGFELPNRIKIIVYSSSPVLEFGNTAPTIVGHANTARACAVGAAPWYATPPYGFGPPAGLEPFSSWGGVPIVFDATGAMLPAPVTYNKPDFVAPDGGNTTFFFADIAQDPDIFPNFFGTSASAPHAAAAALIFEANPGYTKDEVKAALINTADDMLNPGFDYGSGAGLINVGHALSSAIPLNASPNCQDINASITPDGIARINLSNLLKNSAVGLGELNVTVHRGPVLITQRLNVYATHYLVLPNACALAGAELKVTISNALGSCWSRLTFKNNQVPYLPGRAITVYCDDELVHKGGIGGTPPPVLIACGYEPIPTAKFVADWITAYDCVPGIQDTVKVIMREWEAFDKRGNRGVAFDTIVVLQFPEITPENIYCEAKDTVYCADTTVHIGPFITYSRFGICDTLYLVEISDLDKDGMLEFTASDFDDKCGLSIHLDAWKFGGSCETQYKVIVDIKQSCYGTPDLTCPVSPSAGMAPNMAEQLGPGYWRCEFWVTDLDTLAPEILCKDSTSIPIVYTTSHECAAYSYLPPVIVKDDWSGVKQVKATIDGIGTAVLLYNATDKCYESHTQFKLPHRELPYEVVYEAL